MPWPLILVPILWLVAWITASRKDAKDTEAEEIGSYVKSPLALPENKLADYNQLREFLEKKYPKYHIVFINEDETLLGDNVEATPLYMHGLRLWVIKRDG